MDPQRGSRCSTKVRRQDSSVDDYYVYGFEHCETLYPFSLPKFQPVADS